MPILLAAVLLHGWPAQGIPTAAALEGTSSGLGYCDWLQCVVYGLCSTVLQELGFSMVFFLPPWTQPSFTVHVTFRFHLAHVHYLEELDIESQR